MSSRILVIGLGNPIMGDDGIGWTVGEQVQTRVQARKESPAADGFSAVDVECAAEGGLRLMEIMDGYDYAVVVDALNSGKNPPGTVSCFPLEALPDYTVGHIASPHNTTLQTALRLGRELKMHLPRSVTIVGIEAEKVYEITDRLTPDIQGAVPQAVQVVMDLLDDMVGEDE